jgi:hypothetical protein
VMCNSNPFLHMASGERETGYWEISSWFKRSNGVLPRCTVVFGTRACTSILYLQGIPTMGGTLGCHTLLPVTTPIPSALVRVRVAPVMPGVKLPVHIPSTGG